MFISNEAILFVILVFLTVAVFVIVKVFISNHRRQIIANELYNTIEGSESSEISNRSDKDLSDSKTLSEINEIIINNTQGQQLALQRSDTKTLENMKFREITITGSSMASHTAQGAMPILAQAMNISEINRMAPNGLFTATAPISELMKYSNGTYGSPVMAKGRIAGHAGFEKINKPASAALLNPAAVVAVSMQAMAAISGQYYMNQISKQLAGIDHKLDILISYHHDEKIAMLLTLKDSLKCIAAKKYVDDIDIHEIRNLSKDARNVFNEYYLRLQRINPDEIINVKIHSFRTKKTFNELNDNIDKYEIDLSMKVCYYADFLSYQCALAEIALRMRLGDNDNMITNEKLEQITESNKKSFFINIEEEIDRIYIPIINQAEKAVDKGFLTVKADKYYDGETKSDFGKIKNRNIKLKHELNGEEHKSFVNVLHTFEEPKTILYLPGDKPEEHRMFVSEDYFFS